MARSRVPENAPSRTDGIETVNVDAAAPSTNEVKGAGVHKWSEGLQVTGMFRALRSITTQYGAGELVDLEFSSGRRMTFGAPVILANRLREIPAGVTVIIRCLGKVPTPSGQAWNFKVWTPDWVPPSPPAIDADIPF
jgi:hypothetical protein